MSYFHKSKKFVSHNLDETRAYVSDAVFFDVDLQPLSVSKFAADIKFWTTGSLRVADYGYVHGLECRPLGMPDDVTITTMTAGFGFLESPRGRIGLSQGETLIYSFSKADKSHLQPGACFRSITFMRAEIEELCQKLIERRIVLPSDFDATLLHDAPEVRSIGALVSIIETTLAAETERAESPAFNLLQDALMLKILEAIPAYRKWFAIAPARPASWQLRRTLDFIAAQSRPVTLQEAAEVSGVGVRSLQLAFQKELGVTPYAYLKRIRLEAVHAVLSKPDFNGKIASVARQWGFSNMGRFANEYWETFGVRPSRRKSR